MQINSHVAYSAKRRRRSGAALICLYGETAMEFWRTAQVMEARVIDAYAKAGSCPEEDELVLINYLEGRRIPLAACGAPSLKRDLIEYIAAKHMLTLPLKLVVGDKRDRRNSTDLATTTALESCTSLKEFIAIDQTLAVASPVFSIASIVEAMDDIDVAIALSHAMASYAVDKWSDNAIIRANALFSYSDLCSSVNPLLNTDAQRVVGRIKKIVRIAKYVAENSYSPRESALQLLMCLPNKMGGFGLPLPSLNQSIDLGNGISLKPDLYWEKAALSIEYNGTPYHSTTRQLDNDCHRKRLFASAGIKVIEIDKTILNNIVATRRIAAKVADALGIRLRADKTNFPGKHEVLRARLLP